MTELGPFTCWPGGPRTLENCSREGGGGEGGASWRRGSWDPVKGIAVVRSPAHMHKLCLSVSVFHTHAGVHTHTHTHTHRHTCRCPHTHTHMQVPTHTYTNTHTHTNSSIKLTKHTDKKKQYRLLQGLSDVLKALSTDTILVPHNSVKLGVDLQCLAQHPSSIVPHGITTRTQKEHVSVRTGTSESIKKKRKRLNDPHSSYLKISKQSSPKQNWPLWMFRLLHATLQWNDCTSSCFLLTLWPWLKVKVIHTGIKMSCLCSYQVWKR